jgi:hypothetical protein
MGEQIIEIVGPVGEDAAPRIRPVPAGAAAREVNAR